MKPKFTTPCFIRKNTPELRKKLEELGYTILFSVRNGYGNGIYACGVCAHAYEGNAPNAIDCGTNEQLFLALAALREDSDKNQWFCDDIEDCKSFFFCEYDDVKKHIHEKMDGWDCDGFHKATVKELIEKFGK